jgi:hypothetical protein
MKSVLLAAVLTLSVSLSVSLSGSPAFAGSLYLCIAETQIGNQTATLEISDNGAVSFSFDEDALKVLVPYGLSPTEFGLGEDTVGYINVPMEMLSIANPAQGGTIGKFQLSGSEVDFDCGKSD